MSRTASFTHAIEWSRPRPCANVVTLPLPTGPAVESACNGCRRVSRLVRSIQASKLPALLLADDHRVKRAARSEADESGAMRLEGFEPPTSGLEGRRSSAELQAPVRRVSPR